MDKAKYFIGQPILAQILANIPNQMIREVVAKFTADRYYKRLTARVHLTSLLYGVFSYCNGLREICEGLLACEGKLNHLGFHRAPPRSTLSDANRERSFRVFEAIYFALVRKYVSFISDSRLKGLTIRNLRIIDSSTIRLFSDILSGVGRPPLDGSRKKGGIKVHALMDAFSGICEFVRVTGGSENDRNFLKRLKFAVNTWLVFDKGYDHHLQFAKWTAQKVWFVTRMKDHVVYTVTKVIQDKSRRKSAQGVVKEEYISISYSTPGTGRQALTLRRICYKAEDGKMFVFLTNHFGIDAGEVATIYKRRWMIELLFKQIKQNFPLRYFWGESTNAIKTQVYAVLIAQLLMVVVRKKAQTKKSFANMITVIRLHLTSYVNLLAFIKDTHKAWRRQPTVTLFSG